MLCLVLRRVGLDKRIMTTTRTAGRLRVTLVRSTIGFDKRQAEVVRGLGLRRLNHTVERQDVPSVRGMIRTVGHLVRVVDEK